MLTLSEILWMVFAGFVLRGFVVEPAEIYLRNWRDKRRGGSH